MATTPPPPPTDAPPEPGPAGFGRLAAAIGFDPGSVGEAIARRVPWAATLAALGVVLFVLVGGAFLCRDVIVDESIEMSRHQMERNPNVPAAQIEHMEQFLRSPLGRAVLVGQQVVILLLALPLITLFLWLGQLVMGGRAGFGQTLSVTAFSLLLSFGVGWAVRTGLVLAKGSFIEVSTGLGVLVDAPPGNALRSLLDLVDPFLLWAVWAAGVALAAPARLSRAMTLGVSIAVYLLLGGLGAALRILST